MSDVPWKSLLDRIGELRPGDRAELRRWRPGRSDGDSRKTLSPAFWRLYTAWHPQDADAETRPPHPDQVRRWAVMLALLAETHGYHGGGLPLGRALAGCGFAEARLVRLLNAPDSAREDGLLKTAGFLSAKAQAFRAADLISFALTTDPDKLETLRLMIARDYYAALDAAAKTEKEGV